MKGRYEHGSIFDVPDNCTVPLDPDEKTDVYGKPIQTPEYKKNLPNPQFNSVKPGIPAFSFTQANRFFSKPLYVPKNNKKNPLLFEDGKFAPDEAKFFFNVGQDNYNYMGKSERKQLNPENKYPGPGQYKIPGFADAVVKEGKKMSAWRDAIRKKEMIKNNKFNENVKKKNKKLKLPEDDESNFPGSNGDYTSEVQDNFLQFEARKSDNIQSNDNNNLNE